jgi:hypothetical protein
VKLVIISVASWAAGLAAYVAAVPAFDPGGVSHGELNALAFVSAIVSGIAVTLVFVPVMLELRARVTSATAHWWMFPLLGAVLGLVTVMFVLVVVSRNMIAGLVSAEARLLYAMAAVSGALFGAGFFAAFGRSPRTASRARP